MNRNAITADYRAGRYKKKKRRGNPSWGKPMGLTLVEPIKPSEWEQLLNTLGIAEKDAPRHPKVREWVKSHHHNRYVPTGVLRNLGMEDYA